MNDDSLHTDHNYLITNHILPCMHALSTEQALLILLLSYTTTTLAQKPTCQSKALTRCPATAPFYNPDISTDASFRIVETTQCPPYNNPGWTNPAEACIFKMEYKLPLTPKMAKQPIPVGEKLTVFENITYLKEDPAPILGALGVFTNGVNIYGVGSPCGYSSKCPDQGAPSKWVDAVESEGHTVDTCGGHAAPSLHYHIHSGIGLTNNNGRKACNFTEDTPDHHSALLGWLFDGYGLYGRYSDGGKLPTDLDSCGGHTHSIDGADIYHYHMPDAYPWTIGCYTGCPEVSNNPRELSFVTTGPYGCT